MKYCNGCKKSKPLSDWNKCRRFRDGLATQCRKCQKNHSRRYREAFPDYRETMRIVRAVEGMVVE